MLATNKPCSGLDDLVRTKAQGLVVFPLDLDKITSTEATGKRIHRPLSVVNSAATCSLPSTVDTALADFRARGVRSS